MYDIFRMPHIELCEYIIKKEYDGKIEVFAKEKYLDLFQCEQEDFVLSARKEEGTFYTLTLSSS